MRTKEEILEKHLPNRTGYPIESKLDIIYNAMEEYAQELLQHSVSNTVCSHIWEQSHLFPTTKYCLICGKNDVLRAN